MMILQINIHLMAYITFPIYHKIKLIYKINVIYLQKKIKTNVCQIYFRL